METPDVNHPEQAGWYAKGVLPGKIGPAVIVGHIDGAGPTGKAGYPGVFAHLRDLTIGDEVDVTEANNVVLTFHVYRMVQVSKDSFPTMDVYRNTRSPELRLITCVGKFVGGTTGYADNEIVFAR
jgi:sortase (surface protein transpeptidase)